MLREVRLRWFHSRFIEESFLAGRTSGSIEAPTMMLDISGFTRLTEELQRAGREGAEMVSIVLDRAMGGAVDTVESFDGFVMGFAGDSFTAFFPGCDLGSVLGCALSIQDGIASDTFSLPGGSRVSLSARIGVSSGSSDWAIITAGDRASFRFCGQAFGAASEAQTACPTNRVGLFRSDASGEPLPEAPPGFLFEQGTHPGISLVARDTDHSRTAVLPHGAVRPDGAGSFPMTRHR